MTYVMEKGAAVRKTEEIISEERRKSIEEGKEYANLDYQIIKDIFREKDRTGDYEIFGDKRFIEFELADGYYRWLFSVNDKRCVRNPLDGRQSSSEVSFLVKNFDKYLSYLSTMEQLSAEDGISLSIVGRHQISRGPVQYFRVPGKLISKGYSACEYWTKVIIKCKLYY